MYMFVSVSAHDLILFCMMGVPLLIVLGVLLLEQLEKFTRFSTCFGSDMANSDSDLDVAYQDPISYFVLDPTVSSDDSFESPGGYSYSMAVPAFVFPLGNLGRF